MNTLLGIVLSNLAVATALAAVAWSAGRWLRRPALTHGLWLLVFLKLLTPPLISVPVLRTLAPAVAREAVTAKPVVIVEAPPANPVVDFGAGQPQAAPVAQAKRGPAAPKQVEISQVVRETPRAQPQTAPAPREAEVQRIVLAEPPPAKPAREAAATPFDWSWLPGTLGWLWLGGATAWFSIAAVRVVRFHRLLGLGSPASAELKTLAKRTARNLEVRCPRLVLVPGAISPMLWVFGRAPRLVLPASLVERLTPEQWRTLLAHELAHWKRRDHLVRWLELITLGLYWWCPLVWWARRELQEAEEECCDAWVVTTLPGAARAYALALVETVDFLSGAQAALPPAASGLGHLHLLRRRLTMILRGRTPRALTVTGLTSVAALGLLALPLAPTLAQQAPPGAPEALPAAQPAPLVAVPENLAQKEDPKDDKGDDKADADKARKDVLKVQEEFLKLQDKINQKRRDLEEEIQKEFGKQQRDLQKRLQEAMQKAGFPGAGFPAVGGFPGAGLPGAPGNIQPGGIGLQPQPGLAPLQPGAAGIGGFPGGAPGFGPPRGDVDRRLDELERKIDRLMERLGGGKDKGPGPQRNPGAGGAAPGQPELRRNPEPQAAPAPAKE